jgi:hypothetical protein
MDRQGEDVRMSVGKRIRGKAAALAACALLLASATGCSPKTGTVEGKATIAGTPAGGAEIQFFVKAGAERTGTPFAVAAAGNDGAYRVALPPGPYHVVGRKTVREGIRDRAYKGEYSRNPVSVGAGRTASGIDLALSGMSAAGFVPQEGTGVIGSVRSGGKPARGAFVYAYPSEAGTVRGPAYAAFTRTDDLGRFRLVLREGSFVIVARRKGSGDETGAMQPAGESGGEGERVALKTGTMKDVGAISLRPLQEGKRRRRAEAGGQEKEEAEIRGTVVRDDGSPGAGVHVMAYSDRRMIGRPFAISGKTGGSGAFLLRLPKAGKLYLGARSERGGPVSPGEWVGTFDGTADHSVEIGKGERKDGLSIKVTEKW